MSFRIKIRIILHALLALAVITLVYAAVSPSGGASYTNLFDGRSYFIGPLTPQERLDASSTGAVMAGEPVYFSLKTVRRFDKAILTLKYKNESPAPLIEAGVLDDKKVWNYDLAPIENKLIENLSQKWTTIKSDGLLLLERERRFDSIDQFLHNLPANNRIALYNYDIKQDYKINAYEPSKDGALLNTPLRGSYQFYTYIKNEPLDFNFTFSDLNLNRDPDSLEIILYKDGNAIKNWEFADDGVTSDTGELKPDRVFGIGAMDLSEGVYKIELKASNDIITKRIVSRQSKISFINKVWIAQASGDGLTLYTDSKVMTAETTNPGKLQNIVFSGRKLAVTETFKQFGLRAMKDVSEVKLAKDDVILAGDGMFGFSESLLFNPTMTKLNANTDVDRDGIDYILASYETPDQEGDWKIAHAEFDLTKAYRENGKYSFLISVPNLGTPLYKGKVEITSLKIDLTGKNIFTFLKKYLKRYQYGE